MHAANPVILPVKLITVEAPRRSAEVLDPNPSAASLQRLLYAVAKKLSYAVSTLEVPAKGRIRRGH